MLGVGANTSVSDDSDRKTSSEGREADSETGSQVGISRVLRVRCRLIKLSVDDDSGDEAVDTEDTSHDNGDDGSHDEIRSHNTHGRNTDTSLGCSVGGTEVGKDDSGSDAHEPEEGRAGNALFGSEHG